MGITRQGDGPVTLAPSDLIIHIHVVTIACPSFPSFFFSLSTHVLTTQLNILFSCGYRLHQPNASSPTFDPPLPHPSDSIRAATLQLSKLSFSTSLPVVGMAPHPSRTYGVNPAPTRSEPTTMPLRKYGSELNTQHDEDGGFIFPHAAHMGHEPATDSTSFLSSQSLNSSFLREIHESDGGFGLESSIESLPPSQKLSGLSLLRPDSSSMSSSNPSLAAPLSPSTSSSSHSSSVSLVLPPGPRLSSPLPILAANEIDTTPTATPMGTPRPLNSTPLPSLLQPQINPNQSHVHWRSPRSIARLLGPTSPTLPTAHEQTPLLGDCRNNDDGLHSSPPNSTAEHDLEIGSSGTIPTFVRNTKTKIPFSFVFSLSALRPGPFHLDMDHIKAKMKHEAMVKVPHYSMQAVSAIPAVLLGCLLNILDGVSCKLFLSLRPEALCLVTRRTSDKERRCS
jgi:SulP family sulfate permease